LIKNHQKLKSVKIKKSEKVIKSRKSENAKSDKMTKVKK